MSQQINLFYAGKRKAENNFLADKMLHAMAGILILAVLFYAYSFYQNIQLGQQLQEANKNITAEQNRLTELAAEYSRQRSGLTIEQEIKKLTAEASAQREIIEALKSGVIGSTQGYSEYMQAFARQVVSGLWLTGFGIEGDANKMSISGAALTGELVPAYILRLNNEKVMRSKTFASLQMQLPKEDPAKPLRIKYLEFVLQSSATIEAEKK